MPRSVLPSIASADTRFAPVRSNHAPNTRSNASTSSARNTRCSVAPLGLRRGGSPSGTSASGSSSTRSRPHCAIAYWLRDPHIIAATATCNIPTRGSGDRSGDHPYGLRGSGISPNSSANDPAAPTGPTGTGFRLSPISSAPPLKVSQLTSSSVKLK